MVSRFTVGCGVFVALMEITVLITTGGAPFWPMWAKNLLTAGLLVLAGWTGLTSSSARSENYLIAAWAFSSGQFFVSALNLIPANRPPAILIGVSLYFAISLVALICVLIGLRSDDLLDEEATLRREARPHDQSTTRASSRANSSPARYAHPPTPSGVGPDRS